MEYKIHVVNGCNICEIIADSIVISNLQDAVDVLGNTNYLEASKIILYKHQLSSDFFDLKTRLAGDILQKFSNYQMLLAIVGDFGEFKSKNFKDFVYECNKTGQILFLNSIDKAIFELGKE